ncbi:hypothetical protein SAMN05216553_103164 [Lentzea fradiae]|uniref:Uncharacterized protein n=1 Tax=Lentzea fradiae TaxID=200378 RepID=A0A1G7NQW1_9PSEU|nr:hypothetical protein SAMN05216553_103164 [Lentzea fradiae]
MTRTGTTAPGGEGTAPGETARPGHATHRTAPRRAAPHPVSQSPRRPHARPAKEVRP